MSDTTMSVDVRTVSVATSRSAMAVMAAAAGRPLLALPRDGPARVAERGIRHALGLRLTAGGRHAVTVTERAFKSRPVASE